MIFTSPDAIRWFASLLALGCLVLWRGGPPERMAVAALVATSITTTVARSVIPPEWGFVGWGVLGSNLLLVAALAYVMLRSRRWWPVGSTACAASSTAILGMSLLQPRVMTWAFTAASIAFDYLTVIVLAVGVCLEGPRSLASWRAATPISDTPPPPARSPPPAR